MTENSGMAEADEVIDLSMTYTYPPGYLSRPLRIAVELRNAAFDMTIALSKTEFDECITITNQHYVSLLGDVIRDSDQKAKGIIIYAGQDIVMEE